MAGILSIPDEILDKILSFITYDEVSHLRLVCKTFDASAQRVLNQGFHKVEKYHAQCLRKVKEQLPRRESERRKHPLAVHCDILTSIETRISLLGMTFLKYVELNYCCFIPGKVLDEIFKLLRFVTTTAAVPRAHDLLQELRDISSMAMEHFDEKIAPEFKVHSSPAPKLSVTSYGTLTAGTRRPTPVSSSTSYMPTLRSDVFRVDVGLRQSQTRLLELKKENIDMKQKIVDHRRKINEQGRELIEQRNLIAQQAATVNENVHKIVELTKVLAETEKFKADIQQKLDTCLSLAHVVAANSSESNLGQRETRPIRASFPQKRKSSLDTRRKRHKK